MIVRLRSGLDRRARAGHPWVFSNEIADDVAALPPGGAVDVQDARGRFLGRGYANPMSLIAVRLLTRNPSDDIDDVSFYIARLRDAQAYRDAIAPGRRSLRVVHAEGDGLPGLVVDRFEDVLSAQITTLGMDQRKPLLERALTTVFEPRGAVTRGDTRLRSLEGLGEDRGPWFGDVPETVDIDEHGVRFRVTPLAAQKTGHFFDQADNRRHFASLCRDRRVLDVFSNTGGFSLHALVAGAASALAIDADAGNAERAVANAELNGVADRFEARVGDAREQMEALLHEGRRFGAVIVDPPAFAKSRKVASRALAGYRDVNATALRLVEPGGLFCTCSCSFHILEDRFLEAIVAAADAVGRRLRIVRRGEQAPDHPVVPGVPESRYLKAYVFHVT